MLGFVLVLVMLLYPWLYLWCLPYSQDELLGCVYQFQLRKDGCDTTSSSHTFCGAPKQKCKQRRIPFETFATFDTLRIDRDVQRSLYNTPQ